MWKNNSLSPNNFAFVDVWICVSCHPCRSNVLVRRKAVNREVHIIIKPISFLLFFLGNYSGPLVVEGVYIFFKKRFVFFF